MFRLITSVGLLATLFASASRAVPLPKEIKKEMPQLVLQMKSLDGLFDDYSYIQGQLKELPNWTISPDQLKQFLEAFVPGWKKGLDKTKPWGGYVNLQNTVDASRFVLMLPCNDLVAYLENRGFLGGNDIVEDKKTGIFSSKVLGAPTFFRFQEGYIYVTFIDEKGIEDAKSLARGADIFIKEEQGLLAVRIYMEGVPEQVKKTARSFLSEMGKNGKTGLFELILLGMVGANDPDDFFKRLIRFVDEAKWAVFRIDLVEQLGFEFDLVARTDSAFAREIADFKPRPTRLGGLLDADTAFGLANLFGSFGGLKIDPKEMEEGIAQLLVDANLDGDAVNFAPLARALVDAIRVNEADLAVALKKAPGKDTYTIVLAGKLYKAKSLESAMLTYLKLLPVEKRKHFKPASLKMENGMNVHTLSLHALSPKAKVLFGESDLNFTFDEDSVYAAFGLGGVDRLKEAVKLANKDGARFNVLTDPALLTGLIRHQFGAAQANEWSKRFPMAQKINLFSGKAQGGALLQVRYTLDVVPFLKMAETLSRFWQP